MKSYPCPSAQPQVKHCLCHRNAQECRSGAEVLLSLHSLSPHMSMWPLHSNQVLSFCPRSSPFPHSVQLPSCSLCKLAFGTQCLQESSWLACMSWIVRVSPFPSGVGLQGSTVPGDILPTCCTAVLFLGSSLWLSLALRVSFTLWELSSWV